MPKVTLICGRICCGKSTYAEKLRIREGAVVLSIDEIMLAMFGQHVGDMHDEYVARTEKYLFVKSLELIETGIDVILDWGFWTRDERAYAREFYSSRNIEHEFHCVDISDAEWRLRLEKRNAAISAGVDNANYYIDDNIAAKFGTIFEAPSADEIDVWVRE